MNVPEEGHVGCSSSNNQAPAFLSKSTFALQLHNREVGTDLLALIRTEFGKQNDRITHLEIQNRNQDGEIGLLKQDNLQIHNRIGSMESDRVVPIPNSKIMQQGYSNVGQTAADFPVTFLKKSHQKRGFRLLSLPLTDGKHEPIPIVPFNCSDLNKMGHTLNGIYLVKRSSETSRINVVLCDFQPTILQQSSTLSVTENQLGFLDVKSTSHLSGIYFYVQRGNGPTARDGIIRFHKEQLNIGGAMNLSTGVFTAPKAGVYHFSFSIEKETKSFLDALHIYLRVNGVKMGVSALSQGPFKAPATMQSAFKLKKGDRVDIWKPSSGTLGQCAVFGGDSATEPPCHHFTGWLLEEDSN